MSSALIALVVAIPLVVSFVLIFALARQVGELYIHLGRIMEATEHTHSSQAPPSPGVGNFGTCKADPYRHLN